MIDRRKKSLRVFLGLVFALALVAAARTDAQQKPAAPPPPTAPAAAAASELDLTEIIRDTQRMSKKEHQMGLVWWIPEAYWQAAFAQGGVAPERSEALLSKIRPYNLVAVVDAAIGPMAGMTYTPEPELRKTLRMVDADGNVYSPLLEEEIGPDATNLVAMLKPMLGKMLGPMGENLQFFAFPAQSKAGKTIADPRAEGRITIRLKDEIHVFRLPLGSLIPPKVCPQDKEVLSGAWTYCPWHGVKLVPGSV